MADYNPKTNWLPDDPITEDDLNRIEKGIKDANDDINNHKLQTNNPHRVTKAQVGLGSVDNVRQASKQEFDAHKNDKANPHGVTKSQVGLGNVDNLKQATKEEFDAHKNNTNNPHDVTSEQVNLKTIGWAADTPYDQLPKGMTVTQIPTSSGYPLSNGTLITNNVSEFRCNQILFSHSKTVGVRMLFRVYHHDAGWSEWKEVSATDGDYTNLRARATTKADVGLGNVENYGIATQAEAEAGTSNTKYMTPQRTKQAVDKGTAPLNQNITTVGTTLLNHIDNKNNPHGVTSHQVNRIATGWPANTPYDELPTGITVTQVPSNSGYPISIGTLITNNVTQHRCTQLFFHPSTLTRMWFRIYHSEHGWTSWAEIETTAGAQTKADQAETNAKNASLPRTGGFVDGQIIRQTDGGFHTVYQIVGIPDQGGNQQYLVLAPLNNTPKRLNGVFFGQRTNGSSNYTSDMIMVSFGQGNSGSHRASYQALRTQNVYDNGSIYDLRMVTLTYDGQQHIALLIPREFGVYQNVVFHGYRRGVNPFIVGDSEVSNVADYTEFSPIEGNNGVISNILRNNRWGMEVSPNSYPVGVTAFMVSGTGWNMPRVGFVSGTVETIKTNNLRVTQHFYRIGHAYNNRQCFTRHGYDGTWSPWSENVYVIEVGENVNGSYIRYSNGMQECFFRIPADGSLNTDGVTHYPMPASFVEIYFADGVISSSVATARRALMGNWSVHGDDYDRWSVRVNADVSSSANLNRCYLSAYGRWR
ncbi:hypothetical protein E2L07_05790 [Halalkalibacterium halodurans]|uniref:pyocin knob domain-containing protein n=1 Tax=Halalkalibacterium halodurans TaxID=86665 RepID=UPI001067B724|nr:pyocin knob domain-containing protein [Halalkalibacterium halodurans]TES56196.1 hypothetical protein E2L07_05790 [Halalkalibacterium halodurans]